MDMKKHVLIASFLILGVLAAGCGTRQAETAQPLVISQADEDVVGAVQVSVTEDGASISGKLKVTSSALNVRKEASQDSDTVYSLKQDEVVDYLEEKDGWYKVTIPQEDGKDPIEGYVIADYVKVLDGSESSDSENADSESSDSENTDSKSRDNESTDSASSGSESTDSVKGKIKVTSVSLNVRSKASGSAEKVASLANGDEVEYIGEEKGWYHITFLDVNGKAADGYVSSEYVEKVQ